MAAPNTTPFSPTQFQGWASFYGGNVVAPPPPPPSAFGAAQLGQPPANGQYTGGWAYPDAWANFYAGKQGFQAPQNQNSPAGALAATYYGINVNNPNDPNLLGWTQAYGNPSAILQRDSDWAKSLGPAPNSFTGGWQNPAAWAALFGGTHGFSAPENAGSPASALAAASQIAKTSNPEQNPALLGWVQDFGQPGQVLANTPNWAASLGAPNVNAQGQDVGQTNSQGWDSPLAWAAFYGGFQGYKNPVDNTLEAARNWAGVTDLNDPSLLGWELDYGNPQTVISALTGQANAANAANAAQQAQIDAIRQQAQQQYTDQLNLFNAQQQQIAVQQQQIASLQQQEANLQAKINLLSRTDPTGANAYISQLQGIQAQLGQTQTSLNALSGSAIQQPTLGGVQTSPGFINAAPLPPPPAYPVKYSQLANGVSVVTQKIGNNVYEHRSDGSEWVNGQEVVFPVKGTVAHLLFNQPGSGTNVPSFGTNNVQGAGGEVGAFGLSQLPRASGAAVGGDPFNALYGSFNTTFRAAGTAGAVGGMGTPPGGPVNPLFGFQGGQGGTGGLGAINFTDFARAMGIDLGPDFIPFGGFSDQMRRAQSLGGSEAQAVAGLLRETQLGAIPDLAAPGDTEPTFAVMPLPGELTPFTRSDLGGQANLSENPWSALPDFGGLEQTIQETLGNLGVGWTPPVEPAPPSTPNFPTPDFGGLGPPAAPVDDFGRLVFEPSPFSLPDFGGLTPQMWTPPEAPQEQPGTFLGNIVSGLGNLFTSFNPNTPETSGINQGVTFDQVANAPLLTIPGGAGGEFGGPPGFTVQPTQQPEAQTPFLNPNIQFAPQGGGEAYTPPADVFTDPLIQGGPFGGAPGMITTTGGGEEEPGVYPPDQTRTEAERSIQKFGGKATLYQLAQAKGGDAAQKMLDNRAMLGEGAFNTPLDLSKPLEPQIEKAIPSAFGGERGTVAGKVIEAMQAEAPSAAVQQHLMQFAGQVQQDIKQDVQQDIEEGNAAYLPQQPSLQYNIIPYSQGYQPPSQPQPPPVGFQPPPAGIPETGGINWMDLPSLGPVPDYLTPPQQPESAPETWNIGPPQLRATERTVTDQGKPVNVDLSKPHPSAPLKDIMANAQVDFEAAHPGYTVEVFSAYRDQAGPHGPGSPGGAMDLWIVDPDGNIIPHRGEDTTGLYRELAQFAKGYQQQSYPQYNNAFNWGGAFETWTGSGQSDLEHFDLSSVRGALAPQNLISRLSPLYPTPTTWPQEIPRPSDQSGMNQGVTFDQIVQSGAQPQQFEGNPESAFSLGQGYGGGDVTGASFVQNQAPELFPQIPDISQLLAPLDQGRGGGLVGPILPAAVEAAQAAYNYFYPPSPTFDQIAGQIASNEPTFANLTPQSFEPALANLQPQAFEPTFANMPTPMMGAESSFANMPYNPPPDVTAFGGGPQGGIQFMQYSPTGGGNITGVFRDAGGAPLPSSEAIDNALQEHGYVQFTDQTGVGRYLTVMQDGTTANTIANLTQPTVGSIAATQQRGNLGARLANDTYTNSAIVRDFGYTGEVTSAREGYLAKELPFQTDTTYTTPASTFGGRADPQRGAISGQSVNDTEYTISFPFASNVSRAINANGGITITGPNGVTIEHVFISDIGPNMNPANVVNGQSTANSLNRGADLAPALYQALGVGTDGTVQIRYPGTGGAVAYSSNPTAAQLRAAGH